MERTYANIDIPQTSNLTLEEVDYLFVKDGHTGLSKLTARSAPVQESLKPQADIEKDAIGAGIISGGETEHVEGHGEQP